MIGTIALLIALFISIGTLLAILIYGSIYFLKEREYMIAITFVSAFIIGILLVVGIILIQIGI